MSANVCNQSLGCGFAPELLFTVYIAGVVLKAHTRHLILCGVRMCTSTQHMHQFMVVLWCTGNSVTTLNKYTVLNTPTMFGEAVLWAGNVLLHACEVGGRPLGSLAEAVVIRDLCSIMKE